MADKKVGNFDLRRIEKITFIVKDCKAFAKHWAELAPSPLRATSLLMD